MKFAKIPDIWRAVRNSNKRILLRVHVKWSGVARLTDGEIEVIRPITLICGENGAGKSSLLHTVLHAVVRDTDLTSNKLYCRPLDGALEHIEVEVSSDGNSSARISGREEVGAYFFPTEGKARFAFIDTGMHVPAILDFIKKDANFGDLLEGVDPIRFSAETLRLASLIVGRNYTAISVYEIADTGFGEDLPYFQVESHGAMYGTLGMGYGEIAVIYILWVLSRIASGALILIEEPEAFLSPRAQTALVDVIAKHVKDSQLKVVMTSHSGAIATRMLNEEIIYATRSSGRVVLHSPARTADLVSRLGLVSEKAFIFFVEDLAAEIFARSIIDNYSDRLSGSVEYVRCNGDGNVFRAIDAIPQDIRMVAHVGVLDGDQRAKYDGEDKRIVFLPGEIPPEVLLIEFARSLADDKLGALLSVSPDNVTRASSHADGEELHDWIHTFAKALNIPYSEVFRRLVVAWAEENSGAVQEFVKDTEKFSSAA